MAYQPAKRPIRKHRGMGDLNCPGDPGCPGYVAPGSPDYQTSLLQEILANQQGPLPIGGGSWPAIYQSPFSFSTWLNQNAGTVALVGGGIFLAMFMRGR